jgi:hypothetical protein
MIFRTIPYRFTVNSHLSAPPQNLIPALACKFNENNVLVSEFLFLQKKIMKNAYLILAHTNPEQIKLLIDNLDYLQSTSFFIHIDAKSRIEKRLKILLGKGSNIFFVSERVNVFWGGFSQVEATLNLLRLAYNYYKGTSKVYFHLISGMDFPIKSNAFIYDFYEKNYGTQYIEYNELPYKGWSNNGGIDRLKYYWFMDDMDRKESHKLYLVQKELNIINKHYSVKHRYYGGSQWWSITIDCIKYILDKTVNHSVIDMFKRTFCADEIFFHTMILKSQKFNVCNNNMRYIDWISGPDYPKTLDMSDINKINLSGNLFARKINSLSTPDIINYLMANNNIK